MLSFLQEGQENQDDTQQASAGLSGGIPDGKSVDDGDFLKPAEHSRNLRQSTIVLAVLFSLGVLCLWFMIKKTAPSEASAATSVEEAQIAEAIAQIIGVQTEMDSKMDGVIGRFYKLSEVEQVKVDELKKNPFEHALVLGDFIKQTEDDAADKEAMLREEVNRNAGRLELLSIMASDRGGGCCMIDDKLLYEGDRIDDFTVRQITKRFVELQSQGVIVRLKMTE